MTNIHVLLLLLVVLPVLGRPNGFGLFEYFDEDSSEEVTDSETTRPPPAMPSACQFIDNVFSYFGEVYEFLDQAFNPFYEPPPALPPPPTTEASNTTEEVKPVVPAQG